MSLKRKIVGGNIVKKQIFENVPVSRSEQFSSGDIGFEGSSVEDESKKLGWKYLFDGDVRGEQCLSNGDENKFYSYVSAVGAEFDERNVITLDLKDEKEIACIRIYSHLSGKIIDNRSGRLTYMKWQYENCFPNHVTLYGTNDKDAMEEGWVEISSFNQYALVDKEARWSYQAYNPEEFYTAEEIDLFKKADPNYIELSCDITGNSYRYLKVKINETFYRMSGSSEIGKTGEFGMEELEVFVKSE